MAALVAAGADAKDIEKAEASATKARERAAKKREQAETKREQASKKLERAADKRKAATEKDEDATNYDNDASRLVDKVGGGAAVKPVQQGRVGPGGTQPEAGVAPRGGGRVGPGGEAPTSGSGIVRDPYSAYRVSPTGTVPEPEGETIEHGLSGRVKALVRGAMGALLGHGEKQKVEPRGKPLEPFTGDTVPISEQDIDAAIAVWNERMPARAKGILEARVPTAEEEAQAAQDLKVEESA